jgi:hypothetical protein
MILPAAKILETTVTPDKDGQIVRLQISDGSLDPASPATFRLALTAKLPAYRFPLVTHVEREAMKLAEAVLAQRLRETGEELQKSRAPFDPSPKV